MTYDNHVRNLELSLGLGSPPTSSQSGEVEQPNEAGIELMIKAAESGVAVAAVMNDEKRRRIMTKALHWLETLRDQAMSLSDNSRHICDDESRLGKS